MAFSYFYTIVFLVACLVFLNIINRIIFMRFVKLLPDTGRKWTVKDVIQDDIFNNLVKSLNAESKKKATALRQRLKQVIIASFFVILLLIVVAILSFIK
ncbi:hypothetical protein GCM10025777_03620 [Membranihabitans marinus]